MPLHRARQGLRLHQRVPSAHATAGYAPPTHAAKQRRALSGVLSAAGINGYDGLDLNIEIVEDDACGVLYDLMAGSIEDPLEQTNGARRAGAAPSLVRSFAHHHDHCIIIIIGHHYLFACRSPCLLAHCPASWHKDGENGRQTA